MKYRVATVASIGAHGRRHHFELPLLLVSAGRCALLALVFFSSLVQLTESLRFSSVHIPSLVQRNSHFWLVCQYEINHQPNPGSHDQLYSVKWYRNNEEFYRLLLTDSAAVTAATEPAPFASGGSGGQQQQQYFAQAGVNVLMSSSNATHVRLLNASLESEGVYACEISTQNLSTIRYEKEIRVYVLPHSRLNIIGFKNRYALGDKVDLICSSDYSRPQPALAWFINGQRIGKSGRWFELDAQRKSKLNDPTLVRLSLGLKFKLSLELLAALSATDISASLSDSAASPPNQRNQSHRSLQRQSSAVAVVSLQSGAMSSSSSSPYQLQDKLELQCKYKLTEISDVTFNELVARQAPAPAKPPDQFSAVDADRKPLQEPEWRSKRWIGRRLAVAGGRQQEVRVSKSADNQVTQSKCPADRRALWWALRAPLQQPWLSAHARATDGVAICQLGALALAPDDPVITEATAKDGLRRRRQQQQQRPDNQQSGNNNNKQSIVELELGDSISVDCMTIGALAALSTSSGPPLPSAASVVEETSAADDYDAEDPAVGGAISQPQDDYSHGGQPAPADKDWPTSGQRLAGQTDLHYCTDLASRRRSLISGRFHTNEDQTAAAAASSRRAVGRVLGGARSHQTTASPHIRHVAYLSLAGHLPDQRIQGQQQNSTGFWRLAGAGIHNGADGNYGGDQSAAADNSNNGFPTASVAATNSADSSVSTPGAHNNGAGHSDVSFTLLAPPLLEWFINNQEAPRSSARYKPELPLLAPGNHAAPTHPEYLAAPLQSRTLGGATNAAGQHRPPPSLEEAEEEDEENTGNSLQGSMSDGLTVATGQMEMLPSIDYTEYFANFGSRTIQQQLQLSLVLDKRHFMTADSKLRLRCSSTQAQVLMSDSATMLIVATADDRPAATGGGSGSSGHGWQQRPNANHHRRDQLHQPKGPHQARSSGGVLPAGSGRAAASSTAAASLFSPRQSSSMFVVAWTILAVALTLTTASVVQPINQRTLFRLDYL